MEAPPNLGPQYTEQFRAVFRMLGKRPGIVFDPFFLQGVAADPALNQADGIHPNAAGQKIVFANVWRVLGPMLASRNAG